MSWRGGKKRDIVSGELQQEEGWLSSPEEGVRDRRGPALRKKNQRKKRSGQEDKVGRDKDEGAGGAARVGPQGHV